MNATSNAAGATVRADLVNPDAFMSRMLRRWREHGNYAEPHAALRAAWRRNNDVMNAQLAALGTPEESTWRVIEERTGIGKSESVIVQCAELGLQEQHGALVVVRLIKDADRLAEEINEEAGDTVAAAYHSESGLAVKDTGDYPVIVMCHASFQNALRLNGNGKPEFWNELLNCAVVETGTRGQIVVDEALDIIEIDYLSEDDVHWLQGTLGTGSIRADHPDAYAVLATYRDMFDKFAAASVDVSEPKVVRSTRQAERTAIHSPDLTAFRAWARARVMNRRRGNAEDAARAEKIINAMAALTRQFVIYERRGKRDLLCTARSIIPEGSRGAVVMDATAGSSPVYDLMKAERHRPVEGTRNYANGTLHVGTSARLGMRSMVANGKAEAAELMADIKDRLPSVTPEGTRVLVTCHKDNRPHLAGHAHAFEFFDVAHYGQIDGENGWKGCNHIVQFGLHYRSDTDASVTFMAMKGTPRTAKWLTDATLRKWRHYADIKRAIERGWTVATSVQASTRGEARNVIDGEGNCREFHIWLKVPESNKALARELIDAHVSQLPGIRVVHDYEKIDGKQKASRRVQHEDSLREFLRHSLKPGERLAATEVRKKLGISTATWKRLAHRMQDQGDPLGKR